jgi:hypothetical protein
MKIMLTLVATLLTATALTSSKPRAVPHTVNTNVLTTNENGHHPIAKFFR